MQSTSIQTKTNNKGEQQNENIKSKRVLSRLHTRSQQVWLQVYMRLLQKPYRAKVFVEEAIFSEAYIRGGYGYSVISYNTSIFTCGYLFNRDDELWFAAHTPSYYGEMKVGED